MYPDAPFLNFCLNHHTHAIVTNTLSTHWGLNHCYKHDPAANSIGAWPAASRPGTANSLAARKPLKCCPSACPLC